MNKSSEIFNLDDNEHINYIIKNEGLDILVVSYGGSCSNTLVDLLEKNGYRCRINLWHKILCHCPTYIDVNIPVIYIYDNPIKAFLSHKRRGVGFWDKNQKKLSNNYNVELSDENLLKLMINQFNSWTHIKKDNILVIKSSELFEVGIINKLEKLLNRRVSHFPIQYKTPKVTYDNIEYFKSTELFKVNKSELEKIINYKI